MSHNEHPPEGERRVHYATQKWRKVREALRVIRARRRPLRVHLRAFKMDVAENRETLDRPLEKAFRRTFLLLPTPTTNSRVVFVFIFYFLHTQAVIIISAADGKRKRERPERPMFRIIIPFLLRIGRPYGTRLRSER